MSDSVKTLTSLARTCITRFQQQYVATHHDTGRHRLRVISLVLLIQWLPLSPCIAAPADPLEVKLRYVVLLSTFIRGDSSDKATCIISPEIDNLATESLASKLTFVSIDDNFAQCKSVFVPAELNTSPDTLEAALYNENLLIISDNTSFCNIAHVFLFQNGKRIFFHIDIDTIDQKPFSLAAQVLALSKHHQCDRGKR